MCLNNVTAQQMYRFSIYSEEILCSNCNVCFAVTIQDLSLYINEVKRDNEALELITEIQNRFVILCSVNCSRWIFIHVVKLPVMSP